MPRTRASRSFSIAVWALTLLLGCGGEGGTPTEAPPPVTNTTQVTLQVRVGDGAQGSPAPTDTTYAKGTVLSYTYEVRNGYTDLQVFIDGEPAAAAGTLILDRDRTLGATASPQVIVPQEAAKDVAAATQTMEDLASGSTPPMDAYRSLVSQSQSLESKVPLDSIPRLLAAAAVLGFGPDQAMPVAEALQEIADSLAQASQPAAAAVEASTSPPEIVFLYVNGIRTLPGAEELSARLLAQAVRDAGYSDADRYAVEGFYNPGSSAADLADLGALVCLSREGAALSEGRDEVSGDCAQLLLSRVGGSDLQLAYAQVLARVMNSDATTSIGHDLADRIESLIETSRVVVVAHSQGNLMTHEAFRELERRGQVDPRCVGTVSMAPPVPVTPISGGHAPSAMFVTGATVKDALLQVEGILPGTFPGIGTVPSATNRLSDLVNQTYATLSNFWLGLLSGGTLTLKAGQLLVVGSMELHGVDWSYLTHHRPRVVTALRTQAALVEGACASAAPVATVTVSPATASIAVGATQQLTATLKDASGNTVTGPTITWSSNDTNVATVSATGLVTGVATGAATVTAISEGKTGTASITVTSAGGGLGRGLGADQFVLIQPGTFQMGATNGDGDERPVHTVNITKAFYLQKTEVTQGQWKAVMGSNPSWFSSCGDDCPVERVSWNGIQEFITKLNQANPGMNYRLPTEAEWEFAARAGTTGDYGGSGVLDDMGWYQGNSSKKTHPVAQKLANAWGLYDMHGNVWEWVQDWYSSSYYGASPTNDPTGPTTGSDRVLRGGPFLYDAYYARSAYRYNGYGSPYSSTDTYGFRLARTP